MIWKWKFGLFKPRGGFNTKYKLWRNESLGLTRDVGELFHDAIQIINQYSKDILSVDIPSGLDEDTGEALGISVKANKTVTFHHMKKGLVNRTNYTGEVIVEDIGIPRKTTKIVLQQSLWCI